MTEAAENAQSKLKFTRHFGGQEIDIYLREDRLISFPLGILAFQDCTVFGLTKLPTEQETPIMLLQCVNEPDLAFMVAAPEQLGLTIAEEDRKRALRETGMRKDDTQFLSILSTHPFGDGMALTANLKAPLLIDSTTRVGRQHILVNSEYTTQHKL